MTSTTIILTSTVHVCPNKAYLYQVDKSERLQAYLKSALQWIEKTNLNIILVENSGYEYQELHPFLSNRFEIISFKENELPNDIDAKRASQYSSKGISELFAINYAFDNSKILKESSSFIIKVTARFFVPELEAFLSSHDLNEYDCLIQNNCDRCEVVGSAYNNFKKMFGIYNNEGGFTHHVENLYKERALSAKRVLRCDVFQIEPTQRGGAPMIYTDI